MSDDKFCTCEISLSYEMMINFVPVKFL